MPRFAPVFLDQLNALDANPALDCLHHVIDRKASDGDGGQRFHFYPVRPVTRTVARTFTPGNRMSGLRSTAIAEIDNG